jgi:hypothetical protein
VSDCINPEWWTNKDEAEYQAAKSASQGDIEVYFDSNSMTFKFFLGNKDGHKKSYSTISGRSFMW